MTSYLYFFIKGFLTGATIAAIGGPVGMLCIKKALTDGPMVGVALGIGAGLGDALFGSIAGFGLTTIADFLLSYQTSVNLVGGLLVTYLGITTFFEKQLHDSMTHQHRHGFLRNIATAFLITTTNPATILFFSAIFVSLGAGLTSHGTATSMVIGIFIGSLVWFSSLGLAVSYFNITITHQKMKLINRLLSGCLIAFGIFVIIKTIYL